MSSRIVEALRLLNYEFDTSSPVEEQAWKMLGHRSSFLREGKRTSMCRFQSIVGSLDSNIVWWPIHLLERSHVALEEDWLHGKDFKGSFCVMKHVGAADDPGEGFVDPKMPGRSAILWTPCRRKGYVYIYILLVLPSDKGIHKYCMWICFGG